MAEKTAVWHSGSAVAVFSGSDVNRIQARKGEMSDAEWRPGRMMARCKRKAADWPPCRRSPIEKPALSRFFAIFRAEYSLRQSGCDEMPAYDVITVQLSVIPAASTRPGLRFAADEAGIQASHIYWVPASPAAKRSPGCVEAAGTTNPMGFPLTERH